MATVFQDLKYGLRMLAKNPGFTAVAVLTLALGIGANTAIFSVVNALLLHPYTFQDLDRLVVVWENNKGVEESFDARHMAPADALDLRAQTQVLEGLTMYRCKDLNLAGGGSVQAVLGCAVSPNFFEILGVGAALGRTFTPSEEHPGQDNVVVVSHSFWQRRFGTDPTLLGKTIRLNGRDHTVIGIMPAGFDYPVPMELWTPLALQQNEKVERTQMSLRALGRLKPGISFRQARASLRAFATRMEHQYPKTNSGRAVSALRLREELYQYTLPLFLLLQVAAGFVLLLACANLANLLLSRMLGRQKEIAIRTSLGADRKRLTQLFVSETVLLSLVAGATAIAVSVWSVQLLRTSISPGWTKWVPGWDHIQVDHTVLGFTLAVAATVGILFGLTTSSQASRVDLNNVLKEGGGPSRFSRKFRLRSALAVAQVMFALVLLVGAGLMFQGFVHVAGIYQGFQPANVLTLELAPPEQAYPDAARISAFYTQVLQGVTALPAVESAALVSNLPASNVDNIRTSFTIEGHPTLKASEVPSADLQIASGDFFQVLRVPTVAGRAFSSSDGADSPRVALISQSLATRFLPGQNTLGLRLQLAGPNFQAPGVAIVGVVGDIRQNWYDPIPRPTIYLPFLQAPRRGMSCLLRAAANPISFAPSVRGVVQAIDRDVAVNLIQSMDGLVADSIAIVRIMGILMAIFGVVALTLSSVGIYGVLAQSVAQRTREIGIRLALGAHPRGVLQLVLGQALKLTGIGLALGLPASMVLSHVMASMVFGIVSMNLAILTGLTALLIVVALAAAYIPARRATKVDPMVALRYE